jgi:hypothetical protein
MNDNKVFFALFFVYSIMFQFIYEILIFLQGAGTEFIFTPLGRLFRYFVLNQNIEKYYKPEIYLFLFNLFICAIFYVVSYNWLIYFNTLKTFFKLVVSYIIICIVVWILISFNGIGLATIGLYILLFLIPYFLMVILTIPYFWFVSKCFLKK